MDEHIDCVSKEDFHEAEHELHHARARITELENKLKHARQRASFRTLLDPDADEHKEAREAVLDYMSWHGSLDRLSQEEYIQRFLEGLKYKGFEVRKKPGVGA